METQYDLLPCSMIIRGSGPIFSFTPLWVPELETSLSVSLFTNVKSLDIVVLWGRGVAECGRT